MLYSPSKVSALRKAMVVTECVMSHELVHRHEDYPANYQVYEPVREHIFGRFPDEHLSVRCHIITNLVQQAILRRVFPNRSFSLATPPLDHPALIRTAEILGEYESNIHYGDPLSSLLAF